MPDPCAALKQKVTEIEEDIADLKADEVGATGSLLHGIAGRILTRRHDLVQANQQLHACEAAHQKAAI
jgi:hypothetical protein